MEILWPPGLQRKKADDNFFQEGNDFCFLDSTKYYCVLEDEFENNKTKHECKERNCNKIFESSFLFQLHYDTHHRSTCCQCHLVLPSHHLLDLHISERHHSLLDGSNNQFKCLVVGCKQTYPSETSRKEHLTTSHGYPSNYRYLHCLGMTRDKVNKHRVVVTDVVVDGGDTSKHNGSAHVNNKNNKVNKNSNNNNRDGLVSQSNMNNNKSMEDDGCVGGENHVTDGLSNINNNNNNDNLNNNSNKNDLNNNMEEMEVEVVSQESSHNKRIPKNICFGNHSKKCFYRKN